MGGRSASPQGTQIQLRLCSSFAVVVVLVSLAVFVVLVAFVVCAAGTVLHVPVAELVIRHSN